ncbi:MAG TPA: multicopper oxidase domain-containing protein [Gemmatimonadaceae bacterium]|nr:multicopper oxidase domain-containing protein [Gemmatimonadaceae bacterium]
MRSSPRSTRLLSAAISAAVVVQPSALHPQQSPTADCRHLPTAAAGAAVPNDNRERAGSWVDDTLLLRLTVRQAAWYPEGPNGCAVPAHAFSEEGHDATIPGPLIRVRAGAAVHATLRNTLHDTLWVRGLQDRNGDSLVVTPIAPGAAHAFQFRAITPGTFYYWATRRSDVRQLTADEDGQLVGGLIVDPSDASAEDRVFVLTRWKPATAERERPFELNAINGLSWPHTERLDLVAGAPVRWRVINASNDGHLMHLHGFYFRVLALGDATRNDAFRRARRGALLVTEAMAPGWTMQLEWTPERPGNWIFHCHIVAHMSPAQRLDRMPSASAIAAAAARTHTHNAEHDMAGLVLGVVVRPATSTASAAAETPRRRLRVFANTREGVFGTRPGFAFILQEGEAPPPTDSIRIPGTPIVLTRDEPVEIVVMNRLAQPLAVHWHGLELESYFDGVAGWSGVGGSIAPAIAPGDSFIVRLTPPRAGTFIYHVHNEHHEELASGLYGALLVLEPGQRYDSSRDLVFVVADAGPGVVRSAGRPPFLNGNASPAPVDLVAGETYRLRFIHITANDAQRVTLRGPGAVEWRALARDGADYAPHLATLHPPRNEAGPGTTFDFEFTPTLAGEYLLGVDTFAAGGQVAGNPTVVTIRVRER